MEYRTATVRIRRGDDWQVKPEAEAMDGKTLRFYHGWEITEDDRPQYAGETAWMTCPEDVEPNWPMWIASGDLEFCDVNEGE